MPEILGRLDPEADTSMLTDYYSLTELEQAQVTATLTSRANSMISEAEQNDSGRAIGKFIVAMEDGRVLTANYAVFIGKEQEK